MIKRYYDDLEKQLKPNRALIIYGPRRVGKTTLLNNFLNKTNLKYKLDSGDNIKTQHILSSQDFSKIISYAEGYELLAIDEAQSIPNIGMGLKILIDQVPQIKIVATGSSSFDLSQQVGEPLTGRKVELELYPLSQIELLNINNKHELKELLPQFLIFGSYPEVVTSKSKKEKAEILEELTNSYLMKDILTLEKVKNSKQLFDLLKLLAFQIGREVSINELATQLSLESRTVLRYLDLLEKTFVVVRSGAFSRNLRKEISTKGKYYFLDNGVRNAVISQFNDIDLRNDVGYLWENFVFTERLKKRSYQGIYGETYFWRTYSQQEIDIVEERDGNLFGYECKWTDKKPLKPPKEWLKLYPKAEYHVISSENYFDFVT